MEFKEAVVEKYGDDFGKYAPVIEMINDFIMGKITNFAEKFSDDKY